MLYSRWFCFCNFLKLGDFVTTCNLFVSREGRWSDEAIELFNDLCHVARWRVLMSRVVSYKVCGHGEHEGSPVPAVELYDTNGTQVCYCHSFLVPYCLFLLFFPFSSSAGDWTTKESVFSNWWDRRSFSSPYCPDQLLRPTEPPAQCIVGTLSTGVMQLGCEADFLSPSNAEVKTVWSWTFPPPISS